MMEPVVTHFHAWSYFWAFCYQLPTIYRDSDYIWALPRDILWKHISFQALPLWLTEKSQDFLVIDCWSATGVVVLSRKVFNAKWSFHVPGDVFDILVRYIQHCGDIMVVLLIRRVYVTSPSFSCPNIHRVIICTLYDDIWYMCWPPSEYDMFWHFIQLVFIFTKALQVN